MPQSALHCSICLHPEANKIDKALRAGEKLRIVAEEFKLNGTSSLGRHKRNGHQDIGSKVTVPSEERMVLRTSLEQSQSLLKSQLETYAAAREAGRHTAAVQASVAVGRTIEQISKLTGEQKSAEKLRPRNDELAMEIMGQLNEEQLRAIVKLTEEQRANINAVAIKGGLPASSLLRPVDESRSSTEAAEDNVAESLFPAGTD